MMISLLGTSYFAKLIMTAVIAMLPILELRGAIPIAVAAGVDLIPAFIASIIGNLIPVPFIIIFIRKIFKWMQSKSKKLHALVDKIEKRAEPKKEKVLKYEWWGLFVLVAIPLPGTGAWTGALVAALLDMRVKRAFPAIALGVVAAGLIVGFLTYGVKIIV